MKTQLYVVPTTWQHVRRVGPYLRDADALEARALTGREPLLALEESFRISHETFTVMDGSVPVGIGGIVHDISLSYPWLCGTDRMVRRWSDFARASLEWFPLVNQGALRRGNDLVCACHELNTVHLRWLLWLGFTIDWKEEIAGHRFNRCVFKNV